MPYPVEHRHLTKERILRSARRLFNRHGFDAVSIDDVMADAGQLGEASMLTLGAKATSTPNQSPIF